MSGILNYGAFHVCLEKNVLFKTIVSGTCYQTLYRRTGNLQQFYRLLLRKYQTVSICKCRYRLYFTGRSIYISKKTEQIFRKKTWCSIKKKKKQNYSSIEGSFLNHTVLSEAGESKDKEKNK